MRKLALTVLLGTGMITTLGASESDFGGFFLGANFGGGFGSTNESFLRSVNGVTQLNRDSDLALKGVRGGVHFGYDHMVTSLFLLGLEIYGDFSSHTGKISQDSIPGPVNFSTRLQRREAVGAAIRAGFVVANTTALYLKAGAETAKWRHNFVTDAAAFNIKSSHTSDKRLTGLVLGLGAETKFAKNWRVGVEWNYTKYSSPSDLSLNGLTGGVNVQLATSKSRDLVTNDFRVRVSYKF
jgi:opacity protein-like surface antigen